MPNQIDSIEFKEVSSKIKLDIQSTKVILIAFGLIAGIVRFLLGVLLPPQILFIVASWFLLYFVYEHWVGGAKTPKELYDIYFKYSVGDLLVITLIMHYLGGVEWIVPLFYVITLVMAGVILSKKRAVALGLIASLLYLTLISLEYFEVLPHKPLFLLKPDLYQSPTYVGTQALITVATLYFVAEMVGTFSELLRKRTRQLEEEKERVVEAHQETEEARTVLEIKVKARTKELKELVKMREGIIKERTKELQGKLKELERFQKLTVGRELKMIGLKKEIKRLTKELKKAE